MQFGADERFNGELDRRTVGRVERPAEVDHARRVLPDGERPPRAQFVFAWLHAVGVEVCFQLLDQPREPVDAHDRRPINEQLLGCLELIGPRTPCEPVEESANDLGCGDTECAGLERGGDLRMACRQRCPGERSSLTRCLPDGDEPSGIRIPAAGGLGDESLGRGVPVPACQVAAVDATARALGQAGGAPGLQRLDSASEPGERVDDTYETVVAQATDVGLRIERCAEQRARPQIHDVTAGGLQIEKGGGGCGHGSILPRITPSFEDTFDGGELEA